MNYRDALSKELSYALRHAPWEYELEMDAEGRVPIDQLLNALHREEHWKDVQEADIQEVIAKSEKKRFELKDGMIRAFYGHSIPMKQSRQYVHLSQDMETAKSVGRRHDGTPCILVIDAKRAWDEGVKFYLGNEKVWLADWVDAKYIVDYYISTTS